MRMWTQTLLFLSSQHSHGKIHITYLCIPAPDLGTRSTNSDGRGKGRGRNEGVSTCKCKDQKEEGMKEDRSIMGLRETEEGCGFQNSVVVSSRLP